MAEAQSWEGVTVAHLTTADISLRYLVMPQLTAVIERGGTAIGISADGPYVPELEAAGIRHVPLRHSTRSFDPMGDVRAASELWRILRTERPDVLHTHTPKPGIYGRIVGRLAGVPVVVNTVHGLYATPEDGFAKRSFVYTLEAIASRFSDAELVQSKEDFDLLTRRYIASPKKTIHLGNGVDLDRFDGRRTDARERLRSDLGAGEDDIVVGFVGRLVAEKGLRELIDAARLLGPGYVVVVVGPPEPDKADALTEGEIADAEGDGVRFVGFQPNTRDWYEAFDIFALPSYREGFPRAAMEAAAMGLPVVASDIRGCREVVEPGVTGSLVEVRDADALAAAIGSLGADRDLRRDMAAAAVAKASNQFDENEVVRIVLRSQIGVLRRGWLD